MNYFLPKHFNHNHIEDFLQKFGSIFNLKQKQKTDAAIICTSLHQVSIVGVLLLYKIMEYAVDNKCFRKPGIEEGVVISEAIEKYGFTKLVEDIIEGRQRNPRIYEALNIQVNNNLIIAPQSMIRGRSQESLRAVYVPKLASFYEDSDIAEMILTCISEVLLNFWKHAISDRQSILVAEGNKQKVEICCADTGNGILSTLKESNLKYRNMKPSMIMGEAIKKGVTSKPGTFHMGSGLWILDRIATLSGGIFHIYSEGVCYKNQNKKQVLKECGYWKGTVVYINVPLNRAILMNEIAKVDKIDFGDIKLNIV